MKKGIFICCCLFSLQAHAFQCIAKLDSSSAEIIDHSGNKIHLDHELKLKVMDDCTNLKVESGKVKIYASDEDSFPQEVKLSAGDVLKEKGIQVGEDNEPPFVDIAQMLKGDRDIRSGEHRAFSRDEALENLPGGEILHPSAKWHISAGLEQLKPTALTIVDLKNKTIVAHISPDKTGVFTVNGRLLKFNHHYEWILDKKKGDFYITSKQKSKEVEQQIKAKVKKGASAFLIKLVTATIYQNNGLDYDTKRVLNDAI